MLRIEFDKIFRISPSGIYYEGGKVDFVTLQDKNGFLGEERLSDGEFIIALYDKSETVIAFPFNAFKNEPSAVKGARAKSGSCCLFLISVGIRVKMLENC